jgi:hypothetical protein
MNWEKIDRFYDLDHPQMRSVPLRQLVNWLVHSFTFLIEVRSDHTGGLVPTGFWCNSDRTRRRELVHVGWSEYKELVRRVSIEDVIAWGFSRDGFGGYQERRSAVGPSPVNIHDYM